MDTVLLQKEVDKKSRRSWGNTIDVGYFMSGQYEEKINKKMMYYDYVFPTGEVVEYVREACEIPIDAIVKYILAMPAPEIGAKDVFQFSNFDDATIRLCQRMAEVDNPGLKHVEVGKLLLNDGKERNDGAYTKYGENHAKTGTAIGLIQDLSKNYFLSCIGYIYPLLDSDLQDKCIHRLWLRNVLIQRLLCATRNGKVDVRQMLFMLSTSTYIRRSSNIKTVWGKLISTSEYDFSAYNKNVNFIIEK